jgi:predicted nucleotidyltransferase/uncharacterized protein with HEPN domain
MSKRTDLLYFGRMLDEARVVEELLANVAGEEEFTGDPTLCRATTFTLQTIARMAQNVSSEGKLAHPEIDWPALVNLWEKIRRNERDFDASRLWKAATEDIPPLLAALSRFVPAEPPENGTEPTARELAIPIPHEKVAEYCRKWGIKRLAFFGSVIHGDFDPERSDVDVLVEFETSKRPRGFYGAMPAELAAILGVREVDLLTFNSVDRWIRNDVLAEAVDEYVAA